MIHFPVFEHLQVKNYRLFPGTEQQPGLDFVIMPGLSIIAGINGLGKTTLINVLFRLVVGPFELPKLENAARFGSTARVRETPWPSRREFFTRRVADKAEQATASLTFAIGAQRFCIERSLADCRLLSATVNGQPIDITEGFEAAYKDQVVGSAGLGSFVDFLTTVKFLTFFNEDRRDILWDDQAQRQFFRILFSSPAISQEWVQHEAEIGSADSSARNASAFASRLEKDITGLEEALEKNAGVTAELAATQKLLDADLERQAELEVKAEDLKSSSPRSPGRWNGQSLPRMGPDGNSRSFATQPWAGSFHPSTKRRATSSPIYSPTPTVWRAVPMRRTRSRGSSTLSWTGFAPFAARTLRSRSARR